MLLKTPEHIHKAIEDADLGLASDPNWQKGYERKAKAYGKGVWDLKHVFFCEITFLSGNKIFLKTRFF